MSNSKKIASIAFAGAAVTATTTFMAAGPATAAACRVRNNGVCYTGPVKAKLRAGTTTVFVDTSKNTTLRCKKAVASGSITDPIGPVIGFFKKTVTKWSSCTGPFGLTFNAHFTTSPKIILGGDASGVLSGIGIEINGTGLTALCKASISGTNIPWKYNNAAHSFSFNLGHEVTLKVKAATTNCLGAISANDKAYFSGIYHVSVPVSLTIH